MRLTADNLSVERGGEAIVAAVSFAVEAGEALVVTGPNGVGKSTLLRAVAGLLPVAGGSVTLDPLPDEAERLAEAAHYLGHANAMKRALTVRDNLAFWCGFAGGPSGEAGARRIVEAAEAVGLSAILHLPFGYLSAGQQRRIAIARLLLSHRPLWILDEPTAALDIDASKVFAGLVERHLAGGGLALIATHQPLGLDRARSFSMGGGSMAASSIADEAAV